MGKVKHSDEPIKWTLNIPASVALPIEILLTDPITGEVKYGARAQLITQLLKDHIAKINNTQPEEI